MGTHDMNSTLAEAMRIRSERSMEVAKLLQRKNPDLQEAMRRLNERSLQVARILAGARRG